MSLTGRFSALFLSALALVLVGFSTATYVSARVYLGRQVGDRLDSALAVLTAAAEIHPQDVEWEPLERALPLGQDSGPQRLCWLVFDERGRRVDHSRNLADEDLTAAWRPRPGTAELPARLEDTRGRTWRISQRHLRPESISATGSRAASGYRPPTGPDPDDGGPTGGRRYPALVLTVCVPLGPTEKALATLAWFLVAVSLGTWLLAAGLCRRLSRRALAPLTRMVASARGLDAADPGWSLEAAGTGDELDELGRAFNELLSRLYVAYERQRRFSGDASHQLRTPLTVLIGQIEVALRQERPGEEYRRVLKSALGRAVQLSQVVEALLFLGRAEGDAQLPRGEHLELGHWVSEHLAGGTTAGRAADAVRHQPGNEPLWVTAHPPLLGQLLDNLLDNAGKYGPPGAPIVVETFREGQAAVLAVEDSGPGIPAPDVPRVFEPFYRSAEARRQGTPGVGLGLAVVQRIAVAFGGGVRLRSEPGKGCRVEVRLPIVGDEPGEGMPDVEEAGLSGSMGERGASGTRR